jgi:3-methylfumaryl-CoA hydratase
MPARPSSGRDGAAFTGGVLPKIPMPRRMYAGSTFTFDGDIRVGDKLRREIEFTDVQLRQGSTGTLIVTTQTRRIFTPRGLAMTEAASTVFREDPSPARRAACRCAKAPPTDVPWRRTITPGPVMLFRYSAITFNPHRIHYDRTYCMETEGYPGLVVHGPFAQQCIFDLLRDSTPGWKIKTLAVRARAPLFDTSPFDVIGRPTADGTGGRAVDGDAQGHDRRAGDGDPRLGAFRPTGGGAGSGKNRLKSRRVNVFRFPRGWEVWEVRKPPGASTMRGAACGRGRRR